MLLIIFVLFVQIKNHIAVLFVVIFLGKMITMDAQLFSEFQKASGVTLVNKLCHKKSAISNATEKVATASAHQIFEFDYLCHTVFDHKVAEWVWVLQEDNFRKYNYQTPGIFSTPREKFYPPPKV